MGGKAPFRWVGGKRRLADWIVSFIPEHTTYIEPFGGSAAVLFTKPRSRVEVYNDVDGELVNFFEVLRDRDKELISWIEKTPFSRELYNEYVKDYYGDCVVDDPIERAGRFFFLRYTQFGSKNSGKSGFGSSLESNHAESYINVAKRLDLFADRFQGVYIENEDWEYVVGKYDGKDSVFYFDPPYVGTEEMYNMEFDHGRFVDSLSDIEGRWILSYGELPSGLEDYRVVEKDTLHHVGSGENEGAKEVTERLVMNFNPYENPSFCRTVGDNPLSW